MQWSMRPRPVLAVLATMVAGLALATSAIGVGVGDSFRAMPASSCPPHC